MPGTACGNAYTLATVTVPPPNAGQSATLAEDQSRRTYTGRNPLVHATAIAAGARVIPPQEAASLIRAIEARVRTSKSAVNTGHKMLSANRVRGPWHGAEAMPNADAPVQVEAQRLANSGGKRLQEPGEGLKEMEMAMMDHSAVYDSACEDYIFSDGGS